MINQFKKWFQFCFLFFLFMFWNTLELLQLSGQPLAEVLAHLNFLSSTIWSRSSSINTFSLLHNNNGFLLPVSWQIWKWVWFPWIGAHSTAVFIQIIPEGIEQIRERFPAQFKLISMKFGMASGQSDQCTLSFVSPKVNNCCFTDHVQKFSCLRVGVWVYMSQFLSNVVWWLLPQNKWPLSSLQITET